MCATKILKEKLANWDMVKNSTNGLLCDINNFVKQFLQMKMFRYYENEVAQTIVVVQEGFNVPDETI